MYYVFSYVVNISRRLTVIHTSHFSHSSGRRNFNPQLIWFGKISFLNNQHTVQYNQSQQPTRLMINYIIIILLVYKMYVCYSKPHQFLNKRNSHNTKHSTNRRFFTSTSKTLYFVKTSLYNAAFWNLISHELSLEFPAIYQLQTQVIIDHFQKIHDYAY